MHPRFKTNCRMRQPKIGPNKTEQAYADRLKCMPDIIWYGFERMKFKLADKTFYTPDFIVLKIDGTLEAHEVKGHWEDDARVKIKVAAEQFPFIRFRAFKPLPKKLGGGWSSEEF